MTDPSTATGELLDRVSQELANLRERINFLDDRTHSNLQSLQVSVNVMNVSLTRLDERVASSMKSMSDMAGEIWGTGDEYVGLKARVQDLKHTTDLGRGLLIYLVLPTIVIVLATGTVLLFRYLFRALGAGG